jgi:RNase H-like domain found in reverse transcriptase
MLVTGAQAQCSVMCPVTFDSVTLKATQLNYPVHKKDMLAIVRALTKWCTNLLGSLIIIYTDHHTLENFNTQKDLSRR